MIRHLKTLGPGLLVTAAFVGPGTVTTATSAGASYGFALLWAIGFSVIATIVFQEMAARLGLVAKMDLGQALRESIPNPLARALMAALVVGAIAAGNAAYEMGNIAGAAMALETITGVSSRAWSVCIGASAAAILLVGTYCRFERILVAMVILMSLTFLATAIVFRPDVSEVLSGLCRPTMPAGSLTTVIALIGTTVVPYNLFLHAGAVRAKWAGVDDTSSALRAVRWDTALAVGLGGAMTGAIVVTSASVFAPGTEITNIGQMVEQLRPLLGVAAAPVFAIGLTAAGLTSAITAPLAAAYATAGVLGWRGGLASMRFRLVWFAIIVIGTGCAVLGTKPVSAILFAQAANGILLPIVAVFLIFAVNRRAIMGRHVNGTVANVLGVASVLLISGLAGWKLFWMLRGIL